jgi:16S rRNA (uracil1498-N3)-methyltransferase
MTGREWPPAMSARFYSATPILTERATLDGAEAHHVSHVMRATVGESVTLFDGGGTEFEAVIESLGRSSVDLRIVERREVDRELPFALMVGVALPKGDRQKWLVEKLTELGVTTLVPLVTERGVAQPTAGAIARLDRSVIEASKQCGRNRLMRIAAPLVWEEWISRSEVPADSRRLIAHPGGSPLATLDFALPQPTQLAIGPEGGFTEAEAAAAQAAGWRTVSLGPRTLRVETAAVALVAHCAGADGSKRV